MAKILLAEDDDDMQGDGPDLCATCGDAPGSCATDGVVADTCAALDPLDVAAVSDAFAPSTPGRSRVTVSVTTSAAASPPDGRPCIAVGSPDRSWRKVAAVVSAGRAASFNSAAARR